MLQMTQLEGTPLKVVLTAMVVVLGIFSWILSPILAILVLIGMAGLLPIEQRARTSLVIIGCLSIGLGAALATGDLPISQIAALKLQGSPYQAAISAWFDHECEAVSCCLAKFLCDSSADFRITHYFRHYI